MSSSSSVPRFATPKQLAELLQTSPKAVYNQVYRGTLPRPLRRGRRLLFDVEEVLKSMAESRVPSPTEEG